MNEELVKRLIGNASDIDFTENKILWESGNTIYYKEHLIRLVEIVLEECVERINEFGEDVENGDVFNNLEKQLCKDINDGHLGPILWRASEKLKEHFGVRE